MEWQPIETAPKPYIQILLLFADGDVGSGEWSNLSSGEWGWFTGGGMCYPLSANYPTHWMPLPLPPTSAGGE